MEGRGGVLGLPMPGVAGRGALGVGAPPMPPGRGGIPPPPIGAAGRGGIPPGCGVIGLAIGAGCGMAGRGGAIGAAAGFGIIIGAFAGAAFLAVAFFLAGAFLAAGFFFAAAFFAGAFRLADFFAAGFFAAAFRLAGFFAATFRFAVFFAPRFAAALLPEPFFLLALRFFPVAFIAMALLRFCSIAASGRLDRTHCTTHASWTKLALPAGESIIFLDYTPNANESRMERCEIARIAIGVRDPFIVHRGDAAPRRVRRQPRDNSLKLQHTFC